MATPILSIDLSNEAVDFENTVIEQGFPLLDKQNNNYQLLRRWFGSMVAEAERHGNRVHFYVRNEHGARVECPACFPVSERELEGPFKKALAQLVKRMEAGEVQTSAERAIHSLVKKELLSITSTGQGPDRRCYLFKYRDKQKQWRLVWCPGYRRKDQVPAAPVICTNPSCSQLFLRRSDGRQKCPHCQKIPRVVKPEKRPHRMRNLLAGLALLLLLAGGAVGTWWYLTRRPIPVQPQLVVTPNQAATPVGGQVQFSVKRTDADGERDVSTQVTAFAEDRKLASFAVSGVVATANAPGTTILHFYLGELSTTATLTVNPPVNPNRVLLEPSKVVLGLGATAKLKMMGEYADGKTADLTQAAEWIPGIDEPCFVYRGLLEGLETGRCKVRARYRATPDSEYMEATADVEVVEKQYQSLHVSVDPTQVPKGQAARVVAEVETEDGEHLSVVGSSELKLSVDPTNCATIQPSGLHGQELGSGTVSGTFHGLTANATFEVVAARPPPLVPIATSLELRVGEVADMPGVNPKTASLASSSPQTVQISSANRLVGRSPGHCTVTAEQEGQQPSTIDVTVVSSSFQSIAIEPDQITVRVDDSANFRVTGNVDETHRVELEPNVLDWVRFPRPGYAELDRDSLQITGVQPTDDSAETLTVRLGNLQAAAQVRVIAGPLQLELAPKGPVELPVGQSMHFEVWACYSNGRRVAVPLDRVKWSSQSLEGLPFGDGEVTARQPNVGPLKVTAEYQGQKSNVVEITSGARVPITLVLTPRPSTIAIGGAGTLDVSARSLSGQPVEVNREDVTFQTEAPKLLGVSPATGAYRGIEAGKATITASHPDAKEPASVAITITPLPAPPTPKKPSSVHIVTDRAEPITIPVAVPFDDFRVQAALDGGSASDVTSAATLQIDGDPQQAAVAIQSGRVVGIQPGQATIRAEYLGVKSENALHLQVVAELDVDAIQLTPSSLTLGVHETATIDAVGFKNGQRVGVVTDHPSLQWMSSNSGVVLATGSVLAGVADGTATVTARAGAVVSDPGVAVSVVGPTAPVGKELQISPERLVLRTGESVHVGSDVFVRRDGGDFSEQAVVTATPSSIVAYDPETRTLSGVSPGRGRVTFVVGGQVQALDVDVIDSPPPGPGSRVVLEPDRGVLAVGEQLRLRVYLIAPNGERRGATASAVLTSQDDKIATVDGVSLLGVAAGDVQIAATVPGVQTSGTAQFHVEEISFDRLVFSPPRLDLAAGDRRHFLVYGLSSSGRHLLGNHPNLSIAATGPERECIEVLPASRQVLAVSPGRTKLQARWKDQLEQEIPVNVDVRALAGLIIRPTGVHIGVGESTPFHVFARAAGQLRPVGAADGVQLEVDDPSIAEAGGDLSVVGRAAGTTQAIARFGGREATARVAVEPDGAAQAPPAPAVGLRFIPSVFRMELGTPGDSIRVIRVYADGTQEDVDHEATLVVHEPRDVISIDPTASGPVVRPRKIGQTQVDAQLGDLKTQTPLLVDVTDDIPNSARLVVRPDPLHLEVGRTGRFQQVIILPGNGRQPVQLPYKVTGTPNRIFDVLASGAIRAKSDGMAVVQIRIDAPNSKYSDLHTSARVQVGTQPTSPSGAPNQFVNLVLRGPSRVIEGTEVPFHVSLQTGDGGRDVTNDGAELVLTAGDEQYADVRPGCRFLALKPGTVRLRARRENLMSNTLQVQIEPLRPLERLELVLARRLLAVNESATYRVWGYPGNGGPKQELTHLVTDDRDDAARPHIRFTVVEPNPGAVVVQHQPPSVVARQPGKVTLRATLGDLESAPQEVTVTGAFTPKDLIALRVEPDSVSCGVGKTTPPLEVQVRLRGDRTFRTIDSSLAKIESGDPSILAPVADSPNRFRGLRPGTTRIAVAFGGQTADVPVRVLANRFKAVTLGELMAGRDEFELIIHIRADQLAGSLEFRCVGPGQTKAGPWEQAVPNGDDQTADVRTPNLRYSDSNFYPINIESRDRTNGSVETYPYAIRLQGGEAQRASE